MSLDQLFIHIQSQSGQFRPFESAVCYDQLFFRQFFSKDVFRSVQFQKNGTGIERRRKVRDGKGCVNTGANGNGAAPHSRNGNGTNGSRVTRKQLAYLHRLGQEHGLDRADLEEMSRAGYGKTSAYLSSREASQFIDQLQGGAR